MTRRRQQTVTLKRLRRDLDLTLDQVARRVAAEGASLDPSYLSRIERGAVGLPAHHVPHLAAVYGVEPAVIEAAASAARRSA